MPPQTLLVFLLLLSLHKTVRAEWPLPLFCDLQYGIPDEDRIEEEFRFCFGEDAKDHRKILEESFPCPQPDAACKDTITSVICRYPDIWLYFRVSQLWLLCKGISIFLGADAYLSEELSLFFTLHHEFAATRW